jgi:hypothetical protein
MSGTKGDPGQLRSSEVGRPKRAGLSAAMRGAAQGEFNSPGGVSL